MGMYPNAWGPAFWHTEHLAALQYSFTKVLPKPEFVEALQDEEYINAISTVDDEIEGAEQAREKAWRDALERLDVLYALERVEDEDEREYRTWRWRLYRYKPPIRPPMLAQATDEQLEEKFPDTESAKDSTLGKVYRRWVQMRDESKPPERPERFADDDLKELDKRYPHTAVAWLYLHYRDDLQRHENSRAYAEQMVDKYRAHYDALPFRLPCGQCGTHARWNILNNPPPLTVDTVGTEELFNWTVDFHNKVNRDKPEPTREWTHEEAREYYRKNFQADKPGEAVLSLIPLKRAHEIAKQADERVKAAEMRVQQLEAEMSPEDSDTNAAAIRIAVAVLVSLAVIVIFLYMLFM